MDRPLNVMRCEVDDKPKEVRTVAEPRHLKGFLVPEDLIGMLVFGLCDSEYLRVPDFSSHIPPGAKLVSTYFDYSVRCFVFVVEHETFPLVHVGYWPVWETIKNVLVKPHRLTVDE